MAYPTMEELYCADLEQCMQWQDELPAPQTDVERTVHRRLDRRIDYLGSQGIRRVAPELAEKFNDLAERAEKLVGAQPGFFKRM